MANINTELEQIRKAIYGREVRGSIANAIELINKEQISTSTAQTNLDSKFNQLVINAGNSNAEVVAARVKADGTQFDTVGKRLDNLDTHLLNFQVVNVINYRHLVKNSNGIENWTEAFNKAFLDLNDGGILIIPTGEYRLTRATLSGKKGITINCAGTIMPLDGTVPLIGTLTIQQVDNCIFNGLNFNGNKKNVINTNSFGTQSLLSFENSKNCVFNNIIVQNTCESGFNSNGNLDNIIFNNIFLADIGEHGFYFGGTNVKNIKFNNLNCNNIGTTDVNKTRYTGVVKFRNKTKSDILHDNIEINGFYFSDAEETATGYKQLLIVHDTKNVKIQNGIVKGARTCIFSTFIGIDNIKIDNVTFAGKYLFYGFNKVTGYDGPATAGKRKIEIKDSDLTCECKNFSEITRINNSKIKLTGNWDDTMSVKELKNEVLLENVEFDLNKFRFDLREFNRSLTVKKCFFSNASTSPSFEINKSEATVYNIVFNDCEEDSEHEIFVQTDSDYNLSFLESVIKSTLKTTKKINELTVVNSKLKTPKLDVYATAKNFRLNGVFNLDGTVRFDRGLKNATCLSYNTTVNLDLRYVISRTLNKEDLLVTNDKGAPFTFSLSNNIVKLDLATRDNSSDTIFKVMYTL